MIEVEALTKAYASRLAVDGVSFTVPSGHVVGFLGPNGAGKTTTLRILAGYMAASSGRVRVAGFEVSERSREVRRRTGYLPEDVPLYRDLTVDAFLRYLAGLKEVSPSRMAGEIDRVCALAGLETVRGLLLAKCSRGFRQRVGLAMALLGDPPVLLFDEPTSGLDPNQVVEVRELIRGLGGEKTVLLSSHILSEVAQICSRVLIIDQGRLVAEGSPVELGRRFGPGEGLRVRVRGAFDPALFRVPGVRDVLAMGEAGRFRLLVEGGEDAAARVARAVMNAGAELLELGPEPVDLETVFRAAVRGASPGDDHA